MLLNSGLDNMALYPHEEFGGRGFGAFIEFAAVGTGATPPTAADTALVSEVARSSRSPWDNRWVYVKGDHNDLANDYVELIQQFSRMLVFQSAAPLSEFGLGPADGPLSVRELFRSDPSDDESPPVVVAVQAGDHLYLQYDLVLRVPWVDAAPVSMGSSGGTPGSGMGGFVVTQDQFDDLLSLPGYPSGWSDLPFRGVFEALWPAGPIVHSIGLNDQPSGLGRMDSLQGYHHGSSEELSELLPYVSGSFEREYVAGIRGFTVEEFPITAYSLSYGPYRVVFDSPFTFDLGGDGGVGLPRFEFTFRFEWGRL